MVCIMRFIKPKLYNSQLPSLRSQSFEKRTTENNLIGELSVHKIEERLHINMSSHHSIQSVLNIGGKFRS